MRTFDCQFFVLLLVATNAVAADAVESELQRLEADCETARQEKLAPLREKYINECIHEQGKDADYCKRFYRDYGERAGNRPAMFYDLPECEAAFEYRKNNR